MNHGIDISFYINQIMQNMGYFAPWSRQNSWVDRVAISNIRKANTPEVKMFVHTSQLVVEKN